MVPEWIDAICFRGQLRSRLQAPDGAALCLHTLASNLAPGAGRAGSLCTSSPPSGDAPREPAAGEGATEAGGGAEEPGQPQPVETAPEAAPVVPLLTAAAVAAAATEVSSAAAVRFALVLRDEDGSASVKRFVLHPGAAVRVGRLPKAEVMLTPSGISNHHLEFRVLPGKSLGIRDLSSNGTGLAPPGGEVERMQKGVDVPVQDGCRVVLPMRLGKSAVAVEGDLRATFSVHLGAGPAKA
ncbi:unnamed protein product [Prorocentrum cordatum]|uniref:FHA domain-containing protein n=1 Tax=Prorocentrum cordatum TaxID=2364126 RepID=A0ABN9U856_9DINO|nr:unnamed protein product [Polarella glacialis]